MRFKLKAGSHGSGTGQEIKSYKAGDVIESDQDLAAFDPLKFERLDDAAKATPAPAAFPSHSSGQGTAFGAMPPLRQHPADLDKMSVKELQDHAADEEIDLKGASKREDILKVLRAGKAK